MTDCYECKHSVEMEHERVIDEATGIIWGGICKVTDCVSHRRQEAMNIFYGHTSTDDELIYDEYKFKEFESFWGDGVCILYEDEAKEIERMEE